MLSGICIPAMITAMPGTLARARRMMAARFSAVCRGGIPRRPSLAPSATTSSDAPGPSTQFDAPQPAGGGVAAHPRLETRARHGGRPRRRVRQPPCGGSRPGLGRAAFCPPQVAVPSSPRHFEPPSSAKPDAPFPAFPWPRHVPAPYHPAHEKPAYPKPGRGALSRKSEHLPYRCAAGPGRSGELAEPKICSICVGFEKFLFVFLEGIKFVLGSNAKAVNTCLTVRWKSRLPENHTGPSRQESRHDARRRFTPGKTHRSSPLHTPGLCRGSRRAPFADSRISRPQSCYPVWLF
jgi:hypothetical protein